MLTEKQLLAQDEPSVRLPVFEGPLDLLLFLIRKNEIHIHDIPIVEVTRQYMDILHEMERLDLEVAGDFFVMAATLMYIKSRILLPKDKRLNEVELEEEGEDPRWELVQQLVEYRAFKEAAHELDNLISNNMDRIPRFVSDKSSGEEERPLKPSSQMDIWNIFNTVLRNLAERSMVGEIADDSVTVADRMEIILEKLETRKSFRFSTLFEGKYTLQTLAASFLAILELVRLRKVNISQDEAFGDILCEQSEPESIFDDLSAEENGLLS